MTAASSGPREGLSRAVVWTGIALGTCLAVLAMTDGARLRIGGVPSWLGVFLGAVIVWVLIAGASVALAELVRRHHKTAARYAARQSGRAARGGWAVARCHGRRGLGAAARWAAPRWAGRVAAADGGEDADARAAGSPQPGPAASQAPPDPGTGNAAGPGPGKPQAALPPRVCAACGKPEGGKRGPLVLFNKPADAAGPGGRYLVHQGHFDDESFNYYGQPYVAVPAPSAPASPNGTGGNTMTDKHAAAGRITPARRARGAAARTGGTVPAAWNAVIARTADFEPDNDGDLLDWMGDEIAAVAAYAEALVDLYESCTQAIGLDPVAMAALHDVADAQAHASETMSGARRKFADHYDRPREFAAEGGLMPHDGRWVTGEGDA
jgi:hypothetical protein